MQKIRLLSALALRAPFEQLMTHWHSAHPSIELDIAWHPSKVLEQQVNQGCAGDAIIATVDTLDRLIADHHVDATSRIEVVDSPIGLATLASQPKPDISTGQKLIDALCHARSVAWSEAGASGVWFTQKIKQLGIDQQLRAKGTIIPSGFTAEQLVNGNADLAVQQLSELLMVAGVDIVGPFPPELQQPVSLSAGKLSQSQSTEQVEQFFVWLKCEEVSAEFARYGMMRRD